MRNFDTWLETFSDSICTYDFFTDFKKVYENINNIKVELNILNSLIGSQSIKQDFTYIVNKYPETLQCIPILLAIRQYEIIVNDTSGKNVINFKDFKNANIELYIKFMQKTGLFNLLANSKIKSLQDYITGVEVGLDSNARKNRTGKTMETLVESHIQNAGYIKDSTYFTQINTADFKDKFGINLLSYIKTNANKKFDFVIKKDGKIYAIEVNFYNTGGSKLNETARSYKEIATETNNLQNFTFIWITDGLGWKSAKNNLRETFNYMQHIYNINDLDNNILKKIIK